MSQMRERDRRGLIERAGGGGGQIGGANLGDQRGARSARLAGGKVGGRKPMMLETHRAFIEARRQEKPDITLQGLCDRLQAERGVKAYPSVMSRFLRHIGVTLKKRRSLPASRTEPT